MRKKISLLALLLCLSSQQMNAVTVHLGLVSFDVQEVTENPIVALSFIAGITAISYVTQDYWYSSLQEFMRKKDEQVSPTIILYEKEKDTKKTEENPMAKIQNCRARIYKAGDITTKFSDVAGCYSAKKDFEDILSFLKDPKAFHDIGAKIPKGVLMQGPPGTGKTLLAKAVAGEAQCPFISICASEFIEAFVGVGAARIRDLFDKAKRLAPCIVFIDEFDAVGKKRSNAPGGGGEEYAQTLAQLLTLMDGFDVVENPIVIIAATNRVDVLDEAILRPGRFDRQVEVGMPYIQDRIDILKVHFKNVKCSDTVDIPLIARATRGFSGAELAKLVNEAAILAVNRRSKIVEMCDVNMAFDHITIGRETMGMIHSQKQMEKTAIHESGHAIAMLYQPLLTDPLYKISITPRGGALGITWSIPLGESYGTKLEEFKANIIMLLAGGIAEEEFGYGKCTGKSNDIMKAYTIAYNMVAMYGMADELDYISYDTLQNQLPNDVHAKVHEQTKKIIDECSIKCKELVALHKDKIKILADLLLEKGTIPGDEVYRMFEIELPAIDFTLS